MVRGVLFDTATLLDLFFYEGGHGAPDPRLLRVPPFRRYTSIVAMFEFICGPSADVMKTRQEWLDRNMIRVLNVTTDICTTFRTLLTAPVECNLRNDLLVAATAKTARLAVASGDHYFEHVAGILWVDEFIP